MAEPKTVSFSQMKDGTKEDYALLAKLEDAYVAELPDRILAHLRALEHSLSGYKIDRLEHCLQSATRALRDGADIDWIVAALLHDIGDDLAPLNHDSLAAAVLAPYVREECVWVTRVHGIFQFKYYGDKVGLDTEARQKYRDHPSYKTAVDFCERWDQSSFDPDYESEPLSTFEPMVREVFSRPAWDEKYTRPGARVPLVNAG